MANSLIDLIIIDTNKTIYQGRVKTISSLDEKGRFDILPFHAHFIALINKTVVVVEENGVEKTFTITDGILKILDNNAKIFLGIETM